MRVPCPNCGANMKISETMINKNGRCPVCKAVLYVYEEKDGKEVIPPSEPNSPASKKRPLHKEAKIARKTPNAIKTVSPNAIIDGIVNINCPKCGTEMELPKNRLDSEGVCPACREIFWIAESEEDLWEFFHRGERAKAKTHIERQGEIGNLGNFVISFPLFLGGIGIFLFASSLTDTDSIWRHLLFGAGVIMLVGFFLLASFLYGKDKKP